MEFPKEDRQAACRITRKMFLSEQSPDGTILAIRCLPMGVVKTVIDLGAYVGMYSLLARFLHPRARVIAVEPNGDSYKVLKRNVAGLQIKAVRCAIGSTGTAYLNPGGRKFRDKFLAKPSQNTPTSGGRVESLSLPELFRKHGIDANGHFLKIDIEGAESHFLGDTKTIDLLRSSVGVDFDLHRGPVYNRQYFRTWLWKHFNESHSICFNWRRVELIRRDVSWIDYPQVRPVAAAGAFAYRTQLRHSRKMGRRELFADAVESVVPAGSSVMDLGASTGGLVMALRCRGWQVSGVDGTPGIGRLTGGVVEHCDLTADCRRLQSSADWALFLEVGEHVPREHEQTLIDNVSGVPRRGLVVSWAKPGTRGTGHVNCREANYVTAEFVRRGWWPNEKKTKKINGFLRKRSRRSFMVFERGD